MTPLVLVHGTWRGRWAFQDGPGTLRRWLRERGYETHVVRWSGDVDGIPSLFDDEEDGDSCADWRAGGFAMRYFLPALKEPAIVIAHSHGVAPVIYQATMPQENGLGPVVIRGLLSVCSPARKQLEQRALAAVEAGRIGYWRHIYAEGWDFWARAGELFDGHLGWRRRWPAAHDNVGLRGIGHSKLLNDPERWPLLLEQIHTVDRTSRQA